MRFYTQEINPVPFVAAVANRRMHDLEMILKRGCSLHHPAFACANGTLQRFDLAVVTRCGISACLKPSTAVIVSGGFHGWPSRNGNWVWMQHLLAIFADGGRMVVMLDREAASRSDGLAEVHVRKRFVESDLIESVILCPWEISRPPWLARSNLTKTPQAVLLVINKAKKRPGEVLFVNARPLVDHYRADNLTPNVVHNAVMDAVCTGRGFHKSSK